MTSENINNPTDTAQADNLQAASSATQEPVSKALPTNPTVAVSKQGRNKQKIIYFLLLFILILAVAAILIYFKIGNFRNMSISNLVGVKPTPTVTVIYNTATPTIAKQITATESEREKMKKVSKSDEISDLEKDLANTDFSAVDNSLKVLDEEFQVTSPLISP